MNIRAGVRGQAPPGRDPRPPSFGMIGAQEAPPLILRHSLLPPANLIPAWQALQGACLFWSCKFLRPLRCCPIIQRLSRGISSPGKVWTGRC